MSTWTYIYIWKTEEYVGNYLLVENFSFAAYRPKICEDTTLTSQQASHWRNAIYHYLNIKADLSVFANMQAASADVYQYNDSCDPEKVQA